MVSLPKVSYKTMEELIMLVFQHPDLYDENSPEFKGINKRARIWEQIATTLNRRGLRGEACKKLWEKERKSYLHYNKTGSKPPLQKEKLFKKMTFLNNKNEGLNGNPQPSNENRQGNENPQQANENNLGPENKDDEKQGGVQNEGPKTTPASAVPNNPQVNIKRGNVKLGSKKEKTPKPKPKAKPKLRLGPQCDNVLKELELFTTKLQTDMASLPREFQIKAQGEIFQVLSKYKSMAHIATGGEGSSRMTM